MTVQTDTQTKTENKKEEKPKWGKLLEIYISPDGKVMPKGSLHLKPLCIDALATAIKIVLAFEEPKKIISGGAMRRFASKIMGKRH